MTVTVPSAAFNKVNEAMRKVLRPASFRTVDRRVWFQVEGGPDTGFRLRVMASDGLRLYENVLPISCEDPEGPSSGSFAPVRLKASKESRHVTIRILPEKTVISFDDVTFTTPAVPKAELDSSIEMLTKFLHDFRMTAANGENRHSTCVNPKLLLQAAESFKDCKTMRVDAGDMNDPVILTGANEDGSVLRIIMPIRSSMSDGEYRRQIAAAAEQIKTEAENHE